MNCIRCGAPLKSIVDGEARVPSESCICCRGLWFNQKNSLSALGVTFIGKTSAVDQLEQKCPSCKNTRLSNYRIEGGQTPVIACPKCSGVWIDGGLFLKLKNAVQEASKRSKGTSAKENFNLAMGLPKNLPPKRQIPWMMFLIVLLFVAGGAGAALFFWL